MFLAPFAKRGNLNRKNIQSVKKVFAELVVTRCRFIKSATMTLRRSSRLNASKVLVALLSLVCVLVSPKTFGTELKAATARAFQ